MTSVLAITFALVYWIARWFRSERRAALLTGLLPMPLDGKAHVIFASTHTRGLLTERDYALARLDLFVVPDLPDSHQRRIALRTARTAGESGASGRGSRNIW